MPTGLMLIGNKQDLDDQNEREVATETGETFAKVRIWHTSHHIPHLKGLDWNYQSLPYCLQIYGAQFMETSAKTGYNVGNCLMDLVRYELSLQQLCCVDNVLPSPPIRTIKVHYEHEGPNRRQKGIQVTNKPKGSGCCGR